MRTISSSRSSRFRSFFSLREIAVIASITIAAPIMLQSAPADAAAHVVVHSNLAHDVSPPLRAMPSIEAPWLLQALNTDDPFPSHEADAGRRGPIPKATPVSAPNTSATADVGSTQAPAPIASFAGLGNVDGAVPPDTQMTVGPTQVLQFVNVSLAVYNKTGATLKAATTMTSFWAGFPGAMCNSSSAYSDPVAVFDTMAQRFVIEIIDTANNALCVAVSTSSDATGTWFRYAWADATGNLPDYTKLGVWPDAYYMTSDEFLGTTGYFGLSFCALKRDAMLTGASASEICKTYVTDPGALGNTYIAAMPASLDGTTTPPAGAPEWMVALSPTLDANSSQSFLTYWKMHVDWANPSNTTVSAPVDILVDPYTEACYANNAGSCVLTPPPGAPLDALGSDAMFRLAYRNFGDHEAMVITHSVDTGAINPDNNVGVRWYELRPSGGALSVFQQGTHSPDATFRWMSSAAMDASGDIGVGYSGSGSSTHPDVRYTGRTPSDPAGSLELERILRGVNQNGAGQTINRWGDYSAMSIDPSDDCTFWYSTEYVNTSVGTGAWDSWIGSFKYPSCTAVTTDNFSIGANPSSVTLDRGGSRNVTISTAVTSGSAQSIALSATGLPSGVSASFSPSTITAGQSSTLTLSASSSAAIGAVAATITGTGTAATQTTSVGVTVQAANDFSISASPASLTVNIGSSGTSTISTAVTNGAAQSVALSASGLPSGVTASFAPATLNAGQSSTLTLAASSSAAAGVSVVTVTGTGSDASHAASVTLTIPAPPSPFKFTPQIDMFPNSVNSAFLVQKDAEPTMATANDGSVYINAPIGGGGGCHIWSVNKTGPTPTPTYLGQSDAGAGGADCEVATSLSKDPTLNPDKDLVAAASLAIQAAEIHTSSSLDGGATWITNAGGSQIVADDRMWLSPGQADKPQEFFMTFRQAPGTGFFVVAKSVDGGLTYNVTGPPMNNVGTTTSNFTGWEGNIVVDPTNSNNIYVIFEGAGPGAPARTACPNSDCAIWLGSSHDGGVNWTETLIKAQSDPIKSYGHIFPALAMDQAGRLYADYTDGTNLYLATAPAPPAAPDGAAVWTEVVVPQTTLKGRPVTKLEFPWIAASKPGQVDLAWYGSNDAVSNANSQWGLFFARSVNGAAPTSSVQVNSRDFHTGWICDGGGGCGGVTTNGISNSGDRRMGDFLTIRDDAQGVAHFAFTHDPLCPCGGSGQPDGRGSFIQYAREIPSDVDHLTITPTTSTIAAGATQAYTVRAFNSLNDNLGDVSGAASFSYAGASTGACAQNACGPTTAGAYTVTASYGGKSITATLNVNAGSLAAMTLTPDTATIAAGGAQSFTTRGTDAYGNDLGDITAGTTFSLSPDGSCSGNSCSATITGAHTVTASNSGHNATADLQVNPGALARMQISPASASIRVGASQAYTAEGFDTFDNRIADETSTTQFSIAPDGECTANSCTASIPGPHTVSGTKNGKTGDASLTFIAPHAQTSASSLTFGDIRVGRTSGAQTVRLINDGTDTLTVASITIGGASPSDFAITDQTCIGSPLAPDASCGVDVKFSPTADGVRSATLQIASDAPNSPSVVDLSGHGLPAPVLAITTPLEGAFLRTTSVLIKGTTEPNSKVRVYEGASLLATVTSLADGTWKVTRLFSEGAHTLRGNATDADGVVSVDATRSFTVDTTAPGLPTLDTPAAGALLNTTTVPVNGHAEPFATVGIYQGSAKIGSTVTAADGSFATTVIRSNGAHTIKVNAVDRAMNAGPFTADRSYAIDSIAPATPKVGTPAEDSYSKLASRDIKGKAEANSTVRISEGASLLATVTAAGDGSFIATATFAEGAHTLTVTATDAAGNVSTALTRHFTEDFHAPAPPKINTPTELSSQTNPTTVSGVGEAFATIRLLVMDDATGKFVLATTTTVDASGNWTLSYNFATGSRRIRATDVDRAGNVSAASGERDFTVS